MQVIQLFCWPLSVKQISFRISAPLTWMPTAGLMNWDVSSENYFSVTFWMLTIPSVRSGLLSSNSLSTILNTEISFTHSLWSPIACLLQGFREQHLIIGKRKTVLHLLDVVSEIGSLFAHNPKVQIIRISSKCRKHQVNESRSLWLTLNGFRT